MKNMLNVDRPRQTQAPHAGDQAGRAGKAAGDSKNRPRKRRRGNDRFSQLKLIVTRTTLADRTTSMRG